MRTTTCNRNLLGIIYAFYYCHYIIIIMLDQKTRNFLADRGAGRWYIATIMERTPLNGFR